MIPNSQRQSEQEKSNRFHIPCQQRGMGESALLAIEVCSSGTCSFLNTVLLLNRCSPCLANFFHPSQSIFTSTIVELDGACKANQCLHFGDNKPSIAKPYKTVISHIVYSLDVSTLIQVYGIQNLLPNQLAFLEGKYFSSITPYSLQKRSKIPQLCIKTVTKQKHTHA